MKRTTLNPWDWSLQYGFSHAELIEGAERVLYCAGQVSRAPDGTVLHPGDMAGQLELVLDNLDEVLAAGGMSLADVVRLQVFATDIPALRDGYCPCRPSCAGILIAGSQNPAPR